ncbi:MAG: flagellin FliC, partial [Thioalkalivibrio sp.]
TDRQALQAEVAQLIDEIDRVAEQTDFNGTKLLDGEADALSFQIGANAGELITVFEDANGSTAPNMRTDSLGDTDDTDAVSTINIDDFDGAQEAIAIVDAALTEVNSARAEFGATQNRFESVIANLQTASENLSAARSRIQDADFASETAELTRAQILQQAGTSVLAQANASPQNVLALLQ